MRKKLFSVMALSMALITSIIPVQSMALSVNENVIVSEKSAENKAVVTLLGKISSNASKNNYSTWASVINSYLAENSDNTLTRVEYISGTVYIEDYSFAGELLNTKEIEPELPIFGGFYSGTDANYLVFGQNNHEESDATEVVRVVKYDKNWKRISATSIMGANTFEPFAAGTLRMAETNGKLYVYTCHKMYTYKDGLNHQANMTYVIDTSDMSVVDYIHKISNNTTGYVSHSFNQFIKPYGDYIYRADHGDASPRSIYISRCDVNGSITKVDYDYAFTFKGTKGQNQTGTSLGGFELSDSTYIIVGNSINHFDENSSLSGKRNIFVNVSSTVDDSSATFRFITNYTDDSSISVYTPQLVKINDNKFFLMWEERDSTDGATVTKTVMLDKNGTPDEIVTLNARLSDCQPIFCSDEKIRWYASDGKNVNMYTIDPENPETSTEPEIALGDVNDDGLIDAVDASTVLAEYSTLSTGHESTLTEAQRIAADTNRNGRIESSDASLILSYYSYVSTGGETDGLENYVNRLTIDN